MKVNFKLYVGPIAFKTCVKLQEIQTSGEIPNRGGCPGLPVLNSPYGLCGCKATLNNE